MVETRSERLAIGLMSGTSMDGIDAILIKITDEPFTVDTIASRFTPYYPDTSIHLLEIAQDNCSLSDLCRANVALGKLNALAVINLLKHLDIPSDQVSVIGYHGQTVHHLPQPETFFGMEVRSTLQIGDAATVAEETGITVVSNFRAREMAAGGQGAPLVPFFDHAVHTHPTIGRVVLNIGGIANVTFLPPGCQASDVIAFDTGPGNCLMDLLMRKISDGAHAYDLDGKFAATAEPVKAMVSELMTHPFIELAPPKSTGRDDFGIIVLEELMSTSHSISEIMATLADFTASSIAAAIARYWPADKGPEELIASGGGVHNPVMMHLLAEKLEGVDVRVSDEYGINADFKEAAAFAYLADCTMRGMPSNLPSATGASHPVILGQITPA